MNYLNLGCGRRFDPGWSNVDFTSTGKGVIVHNLTQGIPFPDAFFNVVYHSHVLEHFSLYQAEVFLQECYRVLIPQGILRVVVPDLEQITRTYLKALELARTGSQEWAANYEWILLEMYDQVARNHSGGEMAAYLSKEDLVNAKFILGRCGYEAKNLMETAQRQREQLQPASDKVEQYKHLLKEIYRLFRYPKHRREFLFHLVLGKEYTNLQIGRFRQSGEVHQWMYDRYSLAVLLEKSGFKNIIQCTAAESSIPNWTSFNLDTELDGTVYKPDSLFMEAIKP